MEKDWEKKKTARDSIFDILHMYEKLYTDFARPGATRYLTWRGSVLKI